MNESRNKKIVAIFISMVVLFSVVYIALFLFNRYNSSHNENTSQTRIIVGSTSFSQKDIDNKIAIEKAYGNIDTTEEIAIDILVRDATEQEVAKANNALPTAKDVQDFSDNVTASTKAQEILTTIKNIFGNDTDSYNRIYLLPKVTNPKIHAFFASSTALHQNEDITIKEAFKDIQNGDVFEATAKKYGLKYDRTVVADIDVSSPDSLEGIDASQNYPIVIPDYIKTLKAGEFYPSIIDRVDAYLIVRLISKNDNQYDVESILSLKNDYDIWYRNESIKFSPQVFPVVDVEIE